MALFKKKKEVADKSMPVSPKKETLKIAKAKEAKAGGAVSFERAMEESMGGVYNGLDRSFVLIRPHVTEKATDLSGHGVYVFDIHQDANKIEVQAAIEKLYKVKPTKVNIVNKCPKLMKNPRTGRVQTKKTALKKAFVYLKQGDKK